MKPDYTLFTQYQVSTTTAIRFTYLRLVMSLKGPPSENGETYRNGNKPISLQNIFWKVFANVYGNRIQFSFFVIEPLRTEK